MELTFLFTIVLILWNPDFTGSESCRGYRFCVCNKGPKSFKCSNLDYIPRPPRFIQTIELYDNFFYHITRNTFSNLTSNKIKTLIIKHNLIRRIEPDAFVDLQYIEHFEISYEKDINLNDLRISFSRLSKEKLKTLRLEQNGWIDLPGNVFENFNGTRLSKMSLNDNAIVSLNSEVVEPFKRINDFHCRNNSISAVDTKYLRNVFHLDLSDNDISVIPSFCHTSMDGNINNSILKALTLTNNAIRVISRNSFNCLESLETLTLDRNRISILHNNVFSSMHKLTTLSLSLMPELNVIQADAFNTTSLRIFIFQQNGFRFDKSKKYDPKRIFKSFYNLEKLDLSKNFMPCKRLKTLKSLLSPLTQLKELDLRSAAICMLPDMFFRILPNLKYINLMDNKIDSWKNTLFQNVTNLEKLNLQANLIHVINESSFPLEMIKKLKMLDLSENPFWCTCDQKWFLDNLRSLNLSNWPRYYSCYYPEHLRYTFMANYYPSFTECNVIIIIIITVSSVCFLIFVIIGVILRCQMNIRNCLYYLRVYRRLRGGYLRLETSEDFEYDAFVVYCDADRKWVHENLLIRLESSDLKICVHQRDFDAGVPVIENVEHYMNKSWKIIVVMSNEFAKSEWCQWEIDLVSERRRKQGKKALVLVMLKQIDSRHMTSSLRTLLDTTPHITVVNGFGEKLFWKTVNRSVNRPISHPPTAVL